MSHPDSDPDTPHSSGGVGDLPWTGLDDEPVGPLSAEPEPETPAVEVLARIRPPAGQLSLWRLYSNGKTAWVVGDFPPQGDPEGRGFAAARAAWPQFADRGSGSCLAGPGAWQQAERETPVLVPDLAAACEQRDALADALLSVRTLAIEGAPPDLYRDCTTYGQRLGAATAWDWIRAKLLPKVEAALRKAGR